MHSAFIPLGAAESDTLGPLRETLTAGKLWKRSDSDFVAEFLVTLCIFGIFFFLFFFTWMQSLTLLRPCSDRMVYVKFFFFLAAEVSTKCHPIIQFKSVSVSYSTKLFFQKSWRRRRILKAPHVCRVASLHPRRVVLWKPSRSPRNAVFSPVFAALLPNLAALILTSATSGTSKEWTFSFLENICKVIFIFREAGVGGWVLELLTLLPAPVV